MESRALPRFPEVEELPDEDLFTSALAASVALVQERLFLGRCLQEIHRRGLWGQWGYSCLNQFLALALQMDPREGREARRVARALEELPHLAEAAEAGRVRWANLREVVRVATPQTEEFWTQAALTRRSRPLCRMVRRALDGGQPSGDMEAQEATGSRLEFRLLPEELELIQAATAALSAQAEERLDPLQAWLEMSRQVVEGRLRTTPAQMSKTRELLEDLEELREEQDLREFQAVASEMAGENFEPERHARVIQSGSEVREGDLAEGAWELLDRLPELPWAAASAWEAPVPGDPGLERAGRSRVPHWDEAEARARHPGAAMRRHVLRRDGFRCACPECPNQIWLDVHHISFYCQGGLTVPENLVVCCSRCHANIHDGNLRVTGNAEQGLTWTDRRGRPLGSWTPGELDRAVGSALGRRAWPVGPCREVHRVG